MKKLLLTAVILSTLTMCKKADLQEANNTIKNADSLIDNASESLENLDSDAKATLDSVNLKAKDLLKNKEEIEKAFENSKSKIDSISENVEKFKKDTMLWQPLWNNFRWKPEGLCGNLPCQERSTERPVRRGCDKKMWIFSSLNR